jgi:hypothetical protein
VPIRISSERLIDASIETLSPFEKGRPARRRRQRWTGRGEHDLLVRFLLSTPGPALPRLVLCDPPAHPFDEQRLEQREVATKASSRAIRDASANAVFRIPLLGFPGSLHGRRGS